MPKHAISGSDEQLSNANTVEECREECVTQTSCGAVLFDKEWGQKCTLYLLPIDPSTIEEVKGLDHAHARKVTLHLLDRDCLG